MKAVYIEGFHRIGVDDGSIVYMTSDSLLLLNGALREAKKSGKKIAREEIAHKSADDVLDALKEVVGENGTILLPTFCWGFCRGEAFDYRKTKGETGYLGNRALERGDFKRTKHPMYSFAVWGHDADYLCSLENIDSWGADSPFAYCQHHPGQAKFVNIGINNRGEGFTYMHYVEQLCNVPWRFNKAFEADYIDEEGRRETRTYTMFVRDLSYNKETVCSEKFLSDNGLLKKVELPWGNLKLVDIFAATKVFRYEMLVNQGKNILVDA